MTKSEEDFPVFFRSGRAVDRSPEEVDKIIIDKLPGKEYIAF